ncbi:MAG: type IV pilus assembly protein PilM [Candidatus Liptonbacteria bacterium]|nr:type IV pilus assembly protein PilM [Candidatus Liptonbacteria bacterium]
MAFSFFPFSRSAAYLGVDIGTTSIKVVEARRGRPLPELVNYGMLEASDYAGRTTSALQTSSLKLFEQETAELLGMTLAEMKPKSKEAFASLPLFSVFTTVLDFPEMSDAEIVKSIGFQARQYIPLPLSEVALEWMRVGNYEDGQGKRHIAVLLMSIPKEQIQKYRRMFQAVGLHLRALEVEPISAVRSLVGIDPASAVIVDIGSRSTAITFAERGRLTYSVQSDFAGASLTQALATSLHIHPRRAEELKKEKGVLGGGADYELSTILVPFLDVIINEVKKAQFSYAAQLPSASKPERVILTGGSANLPGLDAYFKRELGLPVGRAAPFGAFAYPELLEPVAKELNPFFSVGLGLVLRQLA